MNWELKKITPKNNDYELIFGVLIIPLSILLSAAVLHLPQFLQPICRFHKNTGIPCPTCGASRSMLLLMSGHPLKAIYTQPLITITAILAVIYSIYSFIVVTGKLSRIRPVNVSAKDRKIITISIIAAVTINWLYLIVKGI